MSMLLYSVIKINKLWVWHDWRMYLLKLRELPIISRYLINLKQNGQITLFQCLHYLYTINLNINQYINNTTSQIKHFISQQYYEPESFNPLQLYLKAKAICISMHKFIRHTLPCVSIAISTLCVHSQNYPSVNRG